MMNEIIEGICSSFIVGAMLIRDWRDGRSLFHRNGNNWGADIKHLRTHFNDELTIELKSINKQLTETVHKLDSILIDGVRIKGK